MRDQLFTLTAGSLVLYRDEGGVPGETLFSAPVVVPESLRVEYAAPAHRSQPLGQAYPSLHHVTPPEYSVEVTNLWLLPGDSLAEWRPDGRAKLILDFTLADKRVWYTQRFYGVRCEATAMESEGAMHFVERQRFLAERVVRVGSRSGTLKNVTVQSMTAGFAAEGPAYDGLELGGRYVWGEAMQCREVTLTCTGSTAGATTVWLYVGGVASEYGVVLPAQDTAVPQTVAAWIDARIPAGAFVAWVVTAAPAATEDQVVNLVVSMDVANEDCD